MLKTFSVLTILLASCSCFSLQNKEFGLDHDSLVGFQNQALTNISATYQQQVFSYSNFKDSYFDNLTNNFGMNCKGSCGYVAIGMLLSYYDTYLNGNIVSENYDVNSVGFETDMVERHNSPGSMKETSLNPSLEGSGMTLSEYWDSVSNQDYYDRLMQLNDKSLHAKLAEIGHGIDVQEGNGEDYSLATGFDSRKKVLIKYLSSISGYREGIDYTLAEKQTTSSTVRQWVINEIKNGYPVMLSIASKDGKNNHVVIAYHYDDSSDKIYCHMGWNASTTHSIVTDYGYQTYKTGLSIHFNMKHSHSYNYVVKSQTDGSSTIHCYDSCYIDVGAGVNGHDFKEYHYYDSKHHSSRCTKCNQIYLSNHTYSMVYQANDKTLYGKCSTCGATVKIS